MPGYFTNVISFDFFQNKITGEMYYYLDFLNKKTKIQRMNLRPVFKN
jgi:hypothetical protein